MRVAPILVVAPGLAASAWLLPTSARAQAEPVSATGSHIARDRVAMSAEMLGRVRAVFAKCAYQANPKSIDRLIAAGDSITMGRAGRDATWQKMAESNWFRGCLGEATPGDTSRLRFAPIAFRAMMQEQAYLTFAPSAPAAESVAAPPPPRTFVSEGEALTQAMVYGRLADCVVQQDVMGADALVRTMVDSDAELEAARALAPALGACVTAGQNISLNAASIRLLATDGLWQRFVFRGAPAGSRQ